MKVQSMLKDNWEVMQTNLTWGVCPSVTTHKDQQLDRKTKKSTEDMIISKRGYALICNDE